MKTIHKDAAYDSTMDEFVNPDGTRISFEEVRDGRAVWAPDAYLVSASPGIAINIGSALIGTTGSGFVSWGGLSAQADPQPVPCAEPIAEPGPRKPKPSLPVEVYSETAFDADKAHAALVALCRAA
jgi:hypothetical protein